MTEALIGLILEDRETDVELMVNELRHAGFELAWSRLAATSPSNPGSTSSRWWRKPS